MKKVNIYRVSIDNRPTTVIDTKMMTREAFVRMLISRFGAEKIKNLKTYNS